MENLGERIRYLRKSKSLSLEAVGQYVGVGKSTVRKWEEGIIKNMRRDKIKKLSEVLGVSPGYIMGWTNDPLDYGEDHTSATTVPSDDPLELQLLTSYRNLNTEGQDKVRSYAQDLENNDRYKKDHQSKLVEKAI